MQNLRPQPAQNLLPAPRYTPTALGHGRKTAASLPPVGLQDDSWGQPSPSAALPHWPKLGVGHNKVAPDAGSQAYLIACRAKPVKPEPMASAEAKTEVITPTLNFNFDCPSGVQHEIKALFDQVVDVATGLGLGNSTPQAIKIRYIDRHKWSSYLKNRDLEKAKSSSESGLRAVWTRLTRWLSRLAQIWTTPLYCSKEEANDILVIAKNYDRQSTPEKHKRLAEVLVRCLQRATYPEFFAAQQKMLTELTQSHAASPSYFAREALVEVDVQLCLRALEHREGVVLHHKPTWLSWLWPFEQHRWSMETEAILQRLSTEENIDVWMRRMFNPSSVFARFLFQKGDAVEVSKTLSEQDEAFINTLREINPYGAPRIKR